jgi:hypothetical protein
MLDGSGVYQFSLSAINNKLFRPEDFKRQILPDFRNLRIAQKLARIIFMLASGLLTDILSLAPKPSLTNFQISDSSERLTFSNLLADFLQAAQLT